RRRGGRPGAGGRPVSPQVDGMRFVIEPMRLTDIPAVSAIERLSFPQPWPQSAYRREIQDNRMAHYIVARLAPDASRPQVAVEARPAEATGEPKDEATLIGRLQRLF